jgi:primosomal protein N' (replication factor Y)
LAAVLSIDSSLYSTDFRAYERSFSLITQAVGRSGRSKLSGRAVIQTFTPDNQIIQTAARQDYISFYEEEIANRRTLLFPPFCDLCVVSFSCESESYVKSAAETFMRNMKESIKTFYPDLPLSIIGPVPYSVLRVNNKFRYKLILKCKNTKDFRNMIFNNICDFRNLNEFKNVSVFADINPFSSM